MSSAGALRVRFAMPSDTVFALGYVWNKQFYVTQAALVRSFEIELPCEYQRKKRERKEEGEVRLDTEVVGNDDMVERLQCRLA